MDFTPQKISMPVILMECTKLPPKDGKAQGYIVSYNTPYGQFGGYTSETADYNRAVRLKTDQDGQGIAECRLIGNATVTNGKFVNFGFKLEVEDLGPAPGTGRGKSTS